MTPEEHLLSRYEGILSRLDKGTPLYILVDALVMRCRSMYWGIPGACNPMRQAHVDTRRAEAAEGPWLRTVPRRASKHYRQEKMRLYLWEELQKRQERVDLYRAHNIHSMDLGDSAYFAGKIKPSHCAAIGCKDVSHSLSFYHPKERKRLGAWII